MTAIGGTIMPEIARKVQIGTAASAIAVAALLTPAPIAQADPVAHAPTASLGGSAGVGSANMKAVCGQVGGPSCIRPPAISASPGIRAASPNVSSAAPSITASPGGGLFQNEWVWFGPPNPDAPPLTPVFAFQPLNLLPDFLRPVFSWFADIDYTACIAGLTLRVGPYGTVSGGYSRGCA